MNYLDGSIVSADASATTIVVSCQSSATKTCLSSGYLLPQTLTTGPSFQDYHYDVTSLYNSSIYVVTGTLDCNVTESTLGASCYFSTSTWISSGTHANSSAWATSTSISSFYIKYNTLTVSSGLDNLPTETAATNASPGHTRTSTSTPTGTTESTAQQNHSSSNAWIAGPVIGAVVGLALVAAAAFWFVSRRRKTNSDPVHWDPTTDTPELSENQGYTAKELPTNTTGAKELPTNTTRAELSGQYKPYEMP